jgi:hypothetical protein
MPDARTSRSGRAGQGNARGCKSFARIRCEAPLALPVQMRQGVAQIVEDGSVRSRTDVVGA